MENKLLASDHPFVLSSPKHKGNCYILYTIWYVNALYMAGRTEESRKLFEVVLSCCNGSGTVSEAIDPHTRFGLLGVLVTGPYLTSKQGTLGQFSSYRYNNRNHLHRPALVHSLAQHDLTDTALIDVYLSFRLGRSWIYKRSLSFKGIHNRPFAKKCRIENQQCCTGC